MEKDDWDQMMSECFRAYEAEVRLSDAFKERFVGSIRRRRVLRRLRAFCLAGITVAAIIAIIGLGGGRPRRTDAQTTLIAASQHTNETVEVSGWMLLGYLRECVRRGRTARRREED